MHDFSQLVNSFNRLPEKTALTIKPFIKTRRLTYAALRDKVYQTAAYLNDQGIKKGDRIMVVASNCPEWIELFLGCQLLGAALVPVDARNTLDNTLKFIAQTEPKLVFRGGQILPKLDKKCQTQLLDNLESMTAGYPASPPAVKLSGLETAVIVFTSGTTAEPKGVVLSQHNILVNLHGVERAIDIDSNWRVLSVLPLSHMYELMGECCMLAKGVSTYYLPVVAPLAIARALNEYRITTIFAVPQLLILLKQRIIQTAAIEEQAKSLSAALKIARLLPFKSRRLLFRKVHRALGGCLALVITGGAPIPPEVADFWERMGMKAVQGYGLTETAPILTVNRLNDRRLDSQGLVLHNVELRVGEGGEIQAKGENIFDGYWRNPEQTRQSFTEDGWFRTGDIGRLEKGWLQIQGRAKFAIVLSSGLNVFPEDVEAEAEKHSGFQEICIVGVKTAGSEAVHAVVISDKKDKHIDKAIKDINSGLEEYQHISNWSRWPEAEFPRTLLLKIDRKKVQAWANQEISLQIATKAAGHDISDPLINIIRSSLDGNAGNEIKENDRLSDIGLDSLRRLAVISAIEEQLGIYIAESDIDQTTTLKQLRKMVNEGSHVEAAAKRPVWQYKRPTRLVGSLLRDSLVRGLLRLCLKMKVEGRDNLTDLKPPAIFIFNHVDCFDGPVVYQALPKHIRDRLSAAAADDVMKNHKILTLVSRLGYAAYNLNRDNAVLASLEYTSQLIDKGWNVAIAPEGHANKNGKLQHFKLGIGLLAVETGVPVVAVKTVGLAGTMPLDAKWPQHYSRVTVRIGQPLIIDKSTSYKKATKLLYKQMKQL